MPALSGLLFAFAVSGAAANPVCSDFSVTGCAARAEIHDFCSSAWAQEQCCATCLARIHESSSPATVCRVPRQKCVKWSCAGDQPVGANCTVAAVRSERCGRCFVVDADSCTPFPEVVRRCQPDGKWDGPEAACRRYCDATYVPLEEPSLPVPAPVIASMPSQTALTEPFKVVPIDAPPHGDFLVSKGLDKYMKYRIDVFGHWLVLLTDKCHKKYGTSPSLHVANQYAQWLDWKGTGAPNNQAVFAELVRRNSTMVMFATAGRALDKFFDKYPYDEVLDHHFFHPHDIECDETPYQDGDENTYDNAYCEVSQQLFNMGYRAVWPEIFMDKKGSAVANAMDKLIGDCGHAYDHTFKYPHCTGKYHYSDKTCEYDCLVSEYEWWALTTLLGGQDGHLVPPLGTPPKHGRCREISDEWEQCTRELLEAHDPTIVSILTNATYGLPTKLPFGDYKPGGDVEDL